MYRKTWLEVDLDAVMHNVRTIREICGKRFIAVLKANAYGCGDIEVAEAVCRAGAEMIAVSSTDEAVMIRNRGYGGPLLIVGAVDSQDLPAFLEYDIAVPAYSMAFVDEVTARDCRGLRVHIKVDTGMNRIGFRDIPDMQEALARMTPAGCRVEGIFTHFACADTDPDMTRRQYDAFAAAVGALDHAFEWIHCDNSDASVSFDAPVSNACRVGISLYGTSTFCRELRPALSLYTTMTMVKHVPAGETIGYGATYTAPEDVIIGTLPIGYADGLFRHNQGRTVYVGDQPAEIVGRVCMDQCMIRLPYEYPSGTVVEIFGPHLSREQMADELQTIPHEIMTLLSDRVTRTYKEDGQFVLEGNTRIDASMKKK